MKQMLLVRRDLALPKGKLASQAAHAAVEAVLRSDKDKVKKWRLEGQKKVVVYVRDEKELHLLHESAKKMGFAAALITDAGLTAIAPGTTTCLGLGPDDEDKIDALTGQLKLV